MISIRRSREGSLQNFFVTNAITDKGAISSVDNAHISPLYLYPDDTDSQHSLFGKSPALRGRRPSLSPVFIADFESRLDLKFIPDSTGDLKQTFGPEDVFHYMYAVFHSPTYRQRYAEFLKIDFPRLPLTRDVALFRKLAAKGKELVGLHLLEKNVLGANGRPPLPKFTGRGNNTVATGFPKHENNIVRINAQQGFEGVPEQVWEFQVGGYQVCHKWLKDRRGRELSTEDKAHYAQIAVALQETIRLMKEIDLAIPGWPLE